MSVETLNRSIRVDEVPAWSGGYHDEGVGYEQITNDPDPAPTHDYDRDPASGAGNCRCATPKMQRANQEYDHMRIRTECKNGHPFDAENTHVDSRGWRTCRACGRAKMARQRAAKKVA